MPASAPQRSDWFIAARRGSRVGRAVPSRAAAARCYAPRHADHHHRPPSLTFLLSSSSTSRLANPPSPSAALPHLLLELLLHLDQASRLVAAAAPARLVQELRAGAGRHRSHHSVTAQACTTARPRCCAPSPPAALAKQLILSPWASGGEEAATRASAPHHAPGAPPTHPEARPDGVDAEEPKEHPGHGGDGVAPRLLHVRLRLHLRRAPRREERQAGTCRAPRRARVAVGGRRMAAAAGPVRADWPRREEGALRAEPARPVTQAPRHCTAAGGSAGPREVGPGCCCSR